MCRRHEQGVDSRHAASQVAGAAFVISTALLAFLFLPSGPSSALAAPPAQQGGTPTPVPSPTPLPPFALSNDSGKADYPRLLFDKQGILHIVWDDSGSRAQGVDVLHRQRATDGRWSDVENLTQGFELVFENSNRLLVDKAGNNCVLYDAATREADPSTLGLYLRCRENNVWSTPQFVKGTPGTHRDDVPVFAPDGSLKTLYISSAGDLYFENVKLSDDKAAVQPALVADSNGNYHAVWTREGDPFTLVHRYSTDGGQTWSAPETLDPEGTASGGQIGITPDMQGRVHLVWQTLDGKIFYRRWSQQGGWTPALDLRQNAAANSATTFGIAAAANGLGAVIWQGIDQIVYVEQRPDDTWTVPINLGLAQSSGLGPQVIIDPNGVRNIVWQLQNPNPQLFFATLSSLVSAPVAPASPQGLVYSSPFFQNHIHDPSILISASPATLATNFLLAVVLALAMGFFGNLLNGTLEAHEPEVARLLGPLSRVVYRAREKTGAVNSALRQRRLAWLGTLAQVILLVVLLGIIYAFVDPGFDPLRPDAVLAILALTLSVGLIGMVDDFAQYFFLRRYRETPVLRVHAGNAILAILSALASRVFQITPGILIGNPAGLEEVRETRIDAYLHLVAMGSVAVLSLMAWFLSPLVSSNLFVVTILLLTFAVGVQTLFFEMLPLSNLHGKDIFQLNRWLWAALLGIFAWLFLTTMLNPDGEFLSSFTQPDMVTLAVIVVLFCLFAVGVWFYFNRPARTKQKTDA